MQRQLILTEKFKRAFRKFVRRDARLRKHIEDTLMQMQEDVFSASLGTHKLSGILEGLRACSCGYDCRIVFSLEPKPDNEGELIVLLDIGTHREVY
ncbi:type II toxin-antitoxin system YafQ family toxin [Candidatus Electronema sp. PJ]|uniref:type II toxin-antitoxin system RelE/ParE family toxin n=1 Tax=Candidatus Electronema sp. PJ TaxID=3401572 RepID=UPI003AA99E68